MKIKSKTKKKVYHHLSLGEREIISIGLESGKTQKEISRDLKRSSSTISREIKRNKSEIYNTKYRAHIAQKKFECRSKTSHKKNRLKNDEIRNFVINRIKEEWTPEQIAGRIPFYISGAKTNYESIYLYIYNENPILSKYLTRGKKERHKRSIKQGKRIVKIPNRVNISERPTIVNENRQIGHWEADTVVSRQSKDTLVVLRERKTHFTLIDKIPNRKADSLKDSVIKMLCNIPNQYKKTITFDNGLENAKHEIICNELNVKSYFCNPYHSWEKGAVENTIGLIRRYYPKKSNFKLISNDELEMVFLKLNSRPRKSLGFLTPFEAFEIALEH